MFMASQCMEFGDSCFTQTRSEIVCESELGFVLSFSHKKIIYILNNFWLFSIYYKIYILFE